MTHAAKDPRRPSADRQRAVARAVEQNGTASLLPTTADMVGVVRVAGAVVWRVFTSVTKGSVDTVAELAREVQAGEPITHIVDHQVALVQSAVLHALGIENSQQVPNRVTAKRVTSERDLRSVGNALLKGSWRAEGEPRSQHPSFALMLQSLTPDEARILRFLAVAGPQPAIDIRSKTPFGVGSERLAGVSP